MPFDSEAFNAAQWAKAHEDMDNLRFGAIFRTLTIAGTCLIGVLAWSLKAQYDTMRSNDENNRLTLQAIQNVQARLDRPTLPKPTL